MTHRLLVLFLLMSSSAFAAKPFAIRIVDESTSRGVPLVELKTTNSVRYYTDSNGIAAIDEPSFTNRDVHFTITSHGYEFPADGFKFRGKTLKVVPGEEVMLPIKRLNIAERLYRITGEGIYRDSIMTGQPVPTKEPLLNGQVTGQDSIQSILYRGKIFWFWGDTGRLSYPLGHFGMAGATSDLPGKGGLDPADGINLDYFVDENGFSRPMCANIPGDGMKWIDGLMLLNDPKGREHIVAHYELHKDLATVTDRKLIVYDDKKEGFIKLKSLEVEEQFHPRGHPIKHTVEGTDYYYFPFTYPHMRVKANWASVMDSEQYEGFTCLQTGARYKKEKTELERNTEGKLAWGWKKNTPPLSEAEQEELIKAGQIKADEKWIDLKDVETGKNVVMHGGSVTWNPYRKRWIMIATEFGGKSSMLGEIWFTEAESPEGPYRHARKILTHDRYSFYNPKHHPFLDQQDGRIIYFEGTYTGAFSREEDLTPRYDYNQIMYRLDLADKRLKLPQVDYK